MRGGKGRAKALHSLTDINDIDFRITEEPHIEDRADPAGDKDAAVALKIKEPGGHGRTEGNEFTGEWIGSLPAVRMPGNTSILQRKHPSRHL